MENWIDISKPLKPGMVSWPGQVEPEFKRISDIDKGHLANVTKMSLSVHTGTHMDAPLHFLNGRKDISEFPIETGLGIVKIMQFNGKGPIAREDIVAYESRAGAIEAKDKVFFRTRHSESDWIMDEFNTGYVGLSAEGAQYLAEKDIGLIGMDYLSIAPYNALQETHHILLSKDIWIVEGLDLGKVDEGAYEMICLPLKIEGSDGSPVRVLVRKAI